MKYKEAMNGPDKKEWDDAVDKEHERMTMKKVWKAVKKKDVPKGAKILSSTWAMKKKANGEYRARLTGRGYEQIDGIHFDESSIHAPVTNEVVVRVVMTLGLMAGWLGHLCDIEAAHLCGHLDPLIKMYMSVPQGFEKFYGDDEVLGEKDEAAVAGATEKVMAIEDVSSSSHSKPMSGGKKPPTTANTAKTSTFTAKCRLTFAHGHCCCIIICIVRVL